MSIRTVLYAGASKEGNETADDVVDGDYKEI